MADFPKIPGYKFVSKLAEGGMAIVYLAVQEKLGRKVAIKILDQSFIRTENAAARFEKEAVTAANLSHNNIIQIVDCGNIDNIHYIIMEYLEESLKERMERLPNRKLDPETALWIVKEIMKALDYAHFKGVYHRDIKPENIMFKQDNTPVLLDFGIARVYSSTDNLTKTGIGMGTAYYMSPEQCTARKDIDGRSDVYSLGVVLYEMLTGQLPYEADTLVAIAFQHLQDPIPKLPKDLLQYQPLIDRMMDKDREKRLSNLAQFNELLDQILPNHNLTPPSQPELIQNIRNTNTNSLNPTPIPNNQYTQNTENIKTHISTRTPYEGPTEEFRRSAYLTPPPHSQTRKILTILIPAAVIIIGLFLFLLLSNKEKNPKNPKITNPTATIQQTSSVIPENGPSEAEIKLMETDYNAKYEQAINFINIGRCERAEFILKKLKQLEHKGVKPTNKVKELEEKIKQLNNDFKNYLNKAYKFYEAKEYKNARICIVQARQIKITDELVTLDDNIEARLKDK